MTDEWREERLNNPNLSDDDKAIMRSVWDLYPNRDITMAHDRKTGKSGVVWFKTVVKDPFGCESGPLSVNENEIPISVARRDFDPETYIGDSFGTIMKWPE